MKTVLIQKLNPLKQYTYATCMRTQATIAATCAAYSAGRVLLHLLCACADREIRWHLQGIARELTRQVA